VTDSIFSGRTLAWLMGIGIACFAGMMLLLTVGEDLLPTRSVEATTYSKSAIGHQGWVRLLQNMGVSVLISRNDSLAKSWDGGVLVLAEPGVDGDERQPIDELLQADRLLVVLPKYTARGSFVNTAWAEAVNRIGVGYIGEVLREITKTGTVLQLDKAPPWLPNDFGPAPDLPRPQVVLATGLKPLITSKTGVLLGELQVDGRRIWVLTDPDLISNHGILRGANAQLAMAITDRLREGGPVIFDETIHGYYLDPNLLKAMFQFPLVFVTTAAVATIAVLLWAATGRFGAPARVEPPLRMGKATLVAAGADMLSSGRHESPIADRYRKVVLDEVGRRIHAPLQADERTLGTWLDRVGQARGVRRKFTELWQGFDVPPGSGAQQSRLLLQAAQDFYRWKEEILNGSGPDSQHR
jgi:hypothetical protein